MSGNSGLSRSQTAPIVSRRERWDADAVAISGQERESVLADLDLVAVRERAGGLDPLPVQVRAVEAPHVLDLQRGGAAPDDGVLAGDGDVVEEDVAVRRATDRRLVAFEDERLPRPAAARADNERRTANAELLEIRLPLLLGL